MISALTKKHFLAKTKSLLSRWWVLAPLGVLCFALLTASFHEALRGNNIGADFFTFWMAGRQFFFEKQNPYSSDVAMQTQYQLYGRPAVGNEDRLGYSYPAYNLIPLFPFFVRDFSWAFSAWFVFNFVILILTIFVLSKTPPRIVLFSLPFIYPFAFCLILGNFPILLSAIVIMFYSTSIQKGLRTKGLQILFGFLLAWATSKPQFIWLHMIFILIFIYKERLWTMAVSFIASMAGMLVFCFLWLPGWFQMWVDQLVAYTSYHQYKTKLVLFSLLGSFLPQAVASILTVILLILFFGIMVWLFFVWWRRGTDPVLILAWSGFITYAIDPYGLSYAQLTFWIPMIIWAVQRKEKSYWFSIFWISNMVFSWVLFGLSTYLNIKGPLRDWPLLVYLPWLLWLFYTKINGYNTVLINKDVSTG